MKHARRSTLLVSAAAAALFIMGWTSHAQAQYRVDTGRTNDANPRIGSGGYNTGSDVTQRELNGNQIVTGNVTGLNYFHQSVGYQDPNVLGTATQTGQSDRFLAISGPVNYGSRTTGASNALPFYSTANITTAPPPNFVTTPGNGALIPAPTVSNQTNDTRVGMTNSVVGQPTLARPGELDLPGPVDPSGNTSALTASPLYGIRAWSPNDASDAYFISRYTNLQPTNSSSGSGLDNASIQKMRNELNSTMIDANGQPVNSAQNANGANPNAVNNPAMSANVSGNNTANTPGGAANGTAASGPQNALMQSQIVNNQPLTATPLNSAVSNPQANGTSSLEPGVQQRLLDLVKPEDQTPQLKELEQRLAQQRGKMNNQEANRAYNQERLFNDNSKKLAEATAEPGMNPANPNETPNNTAGTPGMSGGPSDATPTVPAPGTDAGGVPNNSGPNDDVLKKTTPPMNPVVTGPLNSGSQQAYIITSLATGVKAKGLAGLLTTAEDQMRQGKFTNALDTYDSAQQVAPNNPFITLGRGFAELGASYYGKAESDLRRSFAAEPAVLVGQYDLKGFLGEDRLKFIVKDLKEIMSSEKSERPAFLLAYISHNVGDDENAAKYLTEVEQRAGGDDAVIRLMRETWGLKKE